MPMTDPITREEFLEGVRELAEDSEVEVFLTEGSNIGRMVRPHDPVLADKINGIIASIRDMQQYCKIRLER